MVKVKRFLYVTLSIVLGGVSSVFIPASARAANNAECAQGPNTTLVTNSELLVVAPAGETWGNTSAGPYSASVPAGVYTLDYVSFDYHSTHPQDNDPRQEEEQWYIDGYRDGSVVFTSSVTDDVPTDQDYQSGVLDQNIAVPELDSVVLRHVQEVDPTGDLPQSVLPVCVGFTLQQEPCDTDAGFVANDSGTCVCQGDHVVTGNGSTDNPATCQCADGLVSAETDSSQCVACEGDLVANDAKSTCECPTGTTASASDDTTCNEGSQGVLGASTTDTRTPDPDPEPTAPQVLADVAVLSETGASQLAIFAAGVAVITLAVTVLRRSIKS